MEDTDKNEGNRRRIIGVDPGLASTGWGVIEAAGSRIFYIDHGCIETQSGWPHSERLLYIYNGIKDVTERYRPSAASIEKLYFAKNAKSAMPVGEARGVLTLALVQAGLAVREFTPDEIKLAVTGVARADKNQVQEMTRLILALEDKPSPDHAADALAAAICAANNRGF